MNLLSPSGIQVKLEEVVLEQLLEWSEKSFPNETGGILYGYYANDCMSATITGATSQPRGSRSGRTWFERSIGGLQRLLNNLWKSRVYYLGEWHLHPNGSPTPSGQDVEQLLQISKSKSYHCPEPILIILGGRPKGLELKALMFYDEGDYVELQSVSSSTMEKSS